MKKEMKMGGERKPEEMTDMEIQEIKKRLSALLQKLPPICQGKKKR